MKIAIAFWLAGAAAVMAQAPKPTAARPATPRTAVVSSYKDLKYPPLRPIVIPKVDTYTLPDGMRIYLLEDHELPLVHGLALVRTGNLFDPPDKIGLATITGEVLRTGGTASKSGDQLDQELENVAANVESGIGESQGTVSFSALKENAAEVLGIFHDVLTKPEFRQDKVELSKTQFRSSIARRNDDARGILDREFASIVYGRDNPYGWEEQYATIDRIGRGDLQEFYRRYFFPKNIMLAVWGDFDSAKMKADLEKLFADWTVEQPPVPPFPKVPEKAAPGVYLAVKKDVEQTFFSIGHLGGELDDKDYPALEIMADILGGGFQSRLFQEIRTRMGNAYDISANWGANYDHPGLFRISGSTKSTSTVETIKAIQQEVERIRTREVTEEELKTAKETALNSLVFAFDTKTKTLGRILTYEYFGYPRDFIDQYQKALARVTRADVLRVAKAHIDPAKFAILSVGNPDQFVQPLSSLGAVHDVDLTIPEPKHELSAGDAASRERGKQLLAAAQKAAGGIEKLMAIKDYTEALQLNIPQQNLHIQQVNRWMAPSHLREDNDLGQGRISMYSDGKIGWIATPQGSGGLGGPQLKQVKGDLFRSYFQLLMSDRLNGRIVNAVDVSTVEVSDADGNSVRLTLDPKTNLPQSILYDSVAVVGQPQAVQETYSDFHEISGIQVPFRVVITQNGKRYADETTTDFRINTGLRLEDLQRRP
jgi:zinc protease